MKTYYECIPCFLNQTVRCLKDVKPQYQEEVLRRVLHKIGDMDLATSPPEMVNDVFSIIQEYTGKIDYYVEAKKRSNKYILNMYDELSQIISSSEDSFDTALRLAIAGNIIDFGAQHNFSDEMIHSKIDKVLVADGIDSAMLKEKIEKAENILYVGDNAGRGCF